MTESTVDSRVVSACRNWIREPGLRFLSSVVIFAPDVSDLSGFVSHGGYWVERGGYTPSDEVDSGRDGGGHECPHGSFADACCCADYTGDRQVSMGFLQ